MRARSCGTSSAGIWQNQSKCGRMDVRFHATDDRKLLVLQKAKDIDELLSHVGDAVGIDCIASTKARCMDVSGIPCNITSWGYPLVNKFEISFRAHCAVKVFQTLIDVAESVR